MERRMDEEGSPGTIEQLLPKQAWEGKVRTEEWEEGVCEQTEPLSPSCERAFLCSLSRLCAPLPKPTCRQWMLLTA